MTEDKPHITCPHCGTEQPAGAKVCTACGKPLLQKKWYSLKGLNAAEIFLLILGSLMLLIGLVAV